MTQTDPRKSHDEEAQRDPGAHLPHERDESTSSQVQDDQHGQNREVMERAKADVDAGRIDTESRGTPNVVPSGGGNR